MLITESNSQGSSTERKTEPGAEEASAFNAWLKKHQEHEYSHPHTALLFQGGGAPAVAVTAGVTQAMIELGIVTPLAIASSAASLPLALLNHGIPPPEALSRINKFSMWEIVGNPLNSIFAEGSPYSAKKLRDLLLKTAGECANSPEGIDALKLGFAVVNMSKGGEPELLFPEDGKSYADYIIATMSIPYWMPRMVINGNRMRDGELVERFTASKIEERTGFRPQNLLKISFSNVGRDIALRLANFWRRTHTTYRNGSEPYLEERVLELGIPEDLQIGLLDFRNKNMHAVYKFAHEQATRQLPELLAP